jgi:kinetochore protein Fta7
MVTRTTHRKPSVGKPGNVGRPERDSDIQQQRSGQRQRSKYSYVRSQTHRVSRLAIKSRWKHLPKPILGQVNDILSRDVKRTVLANRRDKVNSAVSADDFLTGVMSRITRKLPKWPYPPGTKELHFDLDKVSRQNKITRTELTTEKHSIVLLAREIERAEQSAERDQDLETTLSANAKMAAKVQSRRIAKVSQHLKLGELSMETGYRYIPCSKVALAAMNRCTTTSVRRYLR